MRTQTRIVLAAAGVFLMGALLAIRVLRAPRLTPELRGATVADRAGCFSCHGPGATGGMVNPGSKEGEVPAWDGGNAMMYVNNEQEIREWILFGRPKRLARGHSSHDHATPDPTREASSQEGAERPLLEMPAYEHVLSNSEVEDLVAFYRAVATYYDMPDSASAGLRVARRASCFSCHGAGGVVGGSNPRSFKGYIPPWRGGDFDELVKNQNELVQWVRKGRIDRFESNPLARFFTRRQVIKMPAYEKRLTAEEIRSVVAYINWLQDEETVAGRK